jgi:hypothetical protein
MEPRSPQDLAVHRFRVGAARGDIADAILDFVISLEALLLPYDENARHGDLGYRFRTHGAHYLASNTEDRRAVAKQLSDLYALRSRLVHGSKYPKPEELVSARRTAEDLTRRGYSAPWIQAFRMRRCFAIASLGCSSRRSQRLACIAPPGEDHALGAVLAMAMAPATSYSSPGIRSVRLRNGQRCRHAARDGDAIGGVQPDCSRPVGRAEFGSWNQPWQASPPSAMKIDHDVTT